MTTPFGFPQFDPSKMDPKVMMKLSQLIQSLPPSQLSRMQTLMHNAMAGFDVKKEMEEFEKSLPPGFREQLMGIMAGSDLSAFGAVPPYGAGNPAGAPPSPQTIEVPSSTENMDVHEARLTVLRAVASGSMSPEEAEKILFAS